MNQVTMSGCSGLNGGGIYTSIDQSGKFTIKDSFSLTNCQSTSTGSGGGIYAIINSGEIEMNQVTMSGCSGLNGGGIYTQIEQSGKLTIKESSSFTNCYSSDGNGGGIYVNIDFTTQSQISVQSTTFDSCWALNPQNTNIHRGYGSGIFISGINWDNINNGINLGQVEYNNCKADQGDKGLFIVMNELRELCRLGNPRGQFVRSKDYTIELSNISLLMGYRGSPNQFQSATSEDLKDKISELEYYIRDSGNQWHISTMNSGIDRLSCGLKTNPCKTINYALLLTPLLFEGQYNPNTDIATMILLENNIIDTVININTTTILGNNIAIQSQYGGEDKTLSIDNMYKIGSNSESNTLFNINGDGIKLGLYHLKLNNSFVTSTAPLILLTGDSANNIDAQLHIESCIFAQSGNAPLPELKHNLIQINGGQASIKSSQVSNYLFSNGKSAINVQSITDSQECQLILSGSTFSQIIQKGNVGGSALRATIKSGSTIQLQDYCIFEECICESGLGGAIQIQQNGGILNIKETVMKKCKALNGGGIYSSILTMQEFLIAEEVYFDECDAFSTNLSQGRGGAIYINVGQDAPYEFTVGVNLHFNLNKASQYGRDLFIYCKNIIVMKPDRRILYDMLNETYDKDNAIFGTEFAQESELGRPQMIDFDILQLMLPYYNDIVYISQDQSISENTLKCGRIYLPCVTLSYAETKVLTPEWTYETVLLDSSGAKQVNYTYIIFRGSEITTPFETEVDNIIIRGAFSDEYLFATQRAILIFKGEGQIICSDLAQWQQQGQLERRSVNQYFYIHHLEVVLTEDSEIQSIVKIIGSSSHNDFGRNVELQIEDCIINQESPLYDISFGFLKAEPLITQLIQCKTTQSGISASLQILESGGIILHSEKSQTRCNFNQTPNDPTLLQNTPFESLWLREKEFGVEGSGLIVAYGRTIPSIKADGIQFIGCDAYLSAQLWGAEVALIRSQGNGMSIVNGLRVIGVKQESAVVHCSVFEVISGELSLIDIQIKDVNISENYNEINSLNERKNKIQGLIAMKENAKVLYIEKFSVTNINIENINKQQRMSSVVMNAGHLKLRDGTFLGEAYTSVGSAIRAYPTGPSTIDVEGVLFKGQGDGQGTNGGAVYVDMRQFDVQMSFKRCIFIGNKADYGSNVFIRYASLSQMINKNSFIGCTSIVENNYESDISVCYSVEDNDDEIFIDERNLIHSSWNRQKSEGVVRFISNSDVNHTLDSSMKCGSVSKPCNNYQMLIEYIQLEPESVDGQTGRVETLIFGEGKISSPFIDLSLARSDIINIVGCGDQLTEIYPQQSSFQAMVYGGFNQIVVIERICIANSPASPLIGFIRTQGAESGLVMQDMRVQGYLETSPYNTMLEPPYLFSIEGFVHLQDVIFEHIYLRTGAILQVVGLRRTADDSRIEQLGKTSIGFYRCIFDDITSNESVLISLNEKDLANSSTPSEINKIFNNNVQNNEKTTKFIIEDTIFSECATSLLLSNKNAKGGLLNLKNKKVRFEILNSEYRNIAVKSRNMLYLAWGVYEPDDNQINILTITETFFTNCSSVIPEMDEKVEEQQITQGEVESISDAFCPNNPQYFSSIEYALIYIYKGIYISNNDVYKNTRIGAIRIDNAVVELKNVQFIDPWEESSQLDGSLLMIACKGESNLNVIDPTVNQMTEEICESKKAFKLPPMPIPLLKSAKVVVNVNKDQEAMKFVIEGEQFVLSLFTEQISYTQQFKNELITL
ncbi:MAG: hypothetical protein EZS28_010188 [Streblomastix strix]|uniref:Uncharacterized protein n=1 Tax=Streblomastix strix TaxID=222440 RepID=A0A5J4WJ16_9EUKA|nr:MAG: hypothetical protein EZS28_010188 [Streblomastix strix]